MDWYKTLDIHTKINFKGIYCSITGFGFSDLAGLFSLKERIDLGECKLKLEGLLTHNNHCPFL